MGSPYILHDAPISPVRPESTCEAGRSRPAVLDEIQTGSIRFFVRDFGFEM